MFEGFGNRLKECLKNAGYTHTQVIKELGLSKNAISNYVSGRIPEAKILYQLSLICGKSVEYLLTGTDDSKINALRENEEKLLELYNQLNDRNKIKLEVYAEMKLEEQNSKKNTAGGNNPSSALHNTG